MCPSVGTDSSRENGRFSMPAVYTILVAYRLHLDRLLRNLYFSFSLARFDEWINEAALKNPWMELLWSDEVKAGATGLQSLVRVLGIAGSWPGREKSHMQCGALICLCTFLGHRFQPPFGPKTFPVSEPALVTHT